MRSRILACLVVSVIALPRCSSDSDPGSDMGPKPLVFEGVVPQDGPEHFFVPFDVPDGIEEIEIRHDDQSEDNILDFGLNDPNGYRGWGGGTGEPTLVGREAASRAYVPGTMWPGKWQVVVGKAKLVVSPATYRIELILRTKATLKAQTERSRYVPPPALKTGRRYYAGDFHVHSLESTDAKPSLEDIAVYAESRQLDFVEISDHNTVTQFDFFNEAQRKHPNLLFVPGIEYTTYHGHANIVGAKSFIDHKLGQPGVTIDLAANVALSQGALVSINHPVLELGDRCIGCAWKLDLDPRKVGAVEIETGGLSESGFLFIDKAMAFWDDLLAKGHHIAAIGGSDSHSAGDASGAFSSPIGNPTTMLLMDELSTPAILAAIRDGRTVVKLQGPADPMIELSSSVPPQGDTVVAGSATLSAKVTGAAAGSAQVRFVKNGQAQPEVAVVGESFVHEVQVTSPQSGADRWRVEVMVGGKRRTVTSHLFVARQ